MNAVSGYFDNNSRPMNDGSWLTTPQTLTRKLSLIGASISNPAAQKVIEEAPARFRDIAELYDSRLVQTKLLKPLTGSVIEKLRSVNELRDDSIEYTSQRLESILERLKDQNPLLNSLDVRHFINMHERAAILMSELMLIGKNEPEKHLRKDAERHIIAHPLEVLLISIEEEGRSCTVQALYEIMLTCVFHDSLEDCTLGHSFAQGRIVSFLKQNVSAEVGYSVLGQIATLTSRHDKTADDILMSNEQLDPTPWSRKIGGYMALLDSHHPDEYIQQQSWRRKVIDCLVNSFDQMKRVKAAEKAGDIVGLQKMLATAQAYEYLCLGLEQKGADVMGEVWSATKHALILNQMLLRSYAEILPLDINIV